MDLTWTLVVFAAVMILIWRFLGSYMAAVYQGPRDGTSPSSKGRSTGSSASTPRSSRAGSATPDRSSPTPPSPSSSSTGCSACRVRCRSTRSISARSARRSRCNTAVSFVTNTNWQNYSGESTMSYLSQMGALAVQNFASASVGIAVAIALIRGFARHGLVDDRQLLGRPRPRDHLHPPADLARRRSHLHRPGRHPDLRRPGDDPRRR